MFPLFSPTKNLWNFFLPSTRAKVNQVYGSTEEKEEGEVHKVLGPPLRGGQR